jgi:hypothetical protein
MLPLPVPANRQHVNDVGELFLDHATQEDLEVLTEMWRRVKAANAELNRAASSRPPADHCLARESSERSADDIS